jgi:hypothetical protein
MFDILLIPCILISHFVVLLLMVNSNLLDCFEPSNTFNGSAGSNKKKYNVILDILNPSIKTPGFSKGKCREHRW